MAAKTVVSTPVDEATLRSLDDFCAAVHRKRSEVLRGLLYALLVPGKRGIYEEWREQARRLAPFSASILERRRGPD